MKKRPEPDSMYYVVRHPSKVIYERYDLDSSHPMFVEKQSSIVVQRINYVNNFLLKDSTQTYNLNLALMEWVQKFGFRTDDQMGLTDDELNLAESEKDSIEFLTVFKDSILDKLFYGKEQFGVKKKANTFIRAMLLHYSSGKYSYSYIK